MAKSAINEAALQCHSHFPPNTDSTFRVRVLFLIPAQK